MLIDLQLYCMTDTINVYIGNQGNRFIIEQTGHSEHQKSTKALRMARKVKECLFLYFQNKLRDKNISGYIDDSNDIKFLSMYLGLVMK